MPRNALAVRRSRFTLQGCQQALESIHRAWCDLSRNPFRRSWRPWSWNESAHGGLPAGHPTYWDRHRLGRPVSDRHRGEIAKLLLHHEARGREVSRLLLAAS
ncbi:hypothetical protein AB0C33_36420 [Nonomuraea sp. NPDC048881]|uniref:hypothetical protein n=1 Tax=Nonomuraea sp. NPDC048881 TaxID=3155030 RepID=UPI0033CD7C20